MCNCFVEIELQQYGHLEPALIGNKGVHSRHPKIAGKMPLSFIGSGKANSLDIVIERARDELPRAVPSKQPTRSRLIGDPEYCHYGSTPVTWDSH